MGSLTLHGVSKQRTLEVKLVTKDGTVEVSGQHAFNQSDFGIEPYSTGFGAIGVQDEVSFKFRLVARPPAQAPAKADASPAPVAPVPTPVAPDRKKEGESSPEPDPAALPASTNGISSGSAAPGGSTPAAPPDSGRNVAITVIGVILCVCLLSIGATVVLGYLVHQSEKASREPRKP